MRAETEAIINAVLFIMIIFIIFSWVYKDCTQQNSAREEYNKIVKKNINDKYTLFYAKLCNNSQIDDVTCVMTATSPVYHYTKDQERKTIRTPSQYVLLGGNCKDSAVFYATIFKNLNYTIDFQFPVPHHTMLIISKKITDNHYRYCNIEGNKGTCYEVAI